MLYDEYYLCCTVGATMLPLRYTYAGLSVYLCWTIGIPMLNYRYTYAEPSVPGCYTFLVPLLHDNISWFIPNHLPIRYIMWMGYTLIASYEPAAIGLGQKRSRIITDKYFSRIRFWFFFWSIVDIGDFKRILQAFRLRLLVGSKECGV